MLWKITIFAIGLSWVACSPEPSKTSSDVRSACESACFGDCLSSSERLLCADGCLNESESAASAYDRCVSAAASCAESRECARTRLFVELEEDGSANTATNNGTTSTNSQTNSQTNNQTTANSETNNQTTPPVCGGAGELFCDGACRDTLNDPAHCGDCFVSCPSCEAGVCQFVVPCRGNQDCAPAERCEFDTEFGGFVCAAGARGTDPFGMSCDTNNDCQSGICLNYCTTTCTIDSDCPMDYECSQSDWCQG